LKTARGSVLTLHRRATFKVSCGQADGRTVASLGLRRFVCPFVMTEPHPCEHTREPHAVIDRRRIGRVAFGAPTPWRVTS